MIPLLYDELDNLYTSGDKESVVKANIPSHLIGYLAHAMSCKVTEERNGQYELILTYPSSGKLFDEILPCRCLMVKANQIDDPQLFRIYKTSKVLRGILTVYARHISYDLSGVDYDKQYAGIAPAPAPETWLNTFLLNTNFVGKSDIATTGQVAPNRHVFASVKSFLGGMEGSVLDVFRGEYHWDNFVVNLDAARGSDKGIIIEYGKNLTEMTLADDSDDNYTAIRPFARYYANNGEERVAVGNSISTGIWNGYEWTKILDVTESLGLESGEVPTNAQMAAAANAWWAQQTPDALTLDVSTTEPSKYATLGLCDIVKVRHPRMSVDTTLKVVGLEYDSLAEKYTQITLGQTAGNLAGTVNDITVAMAQMKKEKPIFTNGSKTVDLSGGIATVYDGTNTAKLTATGLSFNDGTATSKLSVIKRTMDSADTETLTLQRGMYLAIVTHTNNTSTGQQGLYVIQAYDSNSVVTTIAAAANSTLTINGLTLTWTTTNTYRALRLIYLS